jgi:hypothetical protein
MPRLGGTREDMNPHSPSFDKGGLEDLKEDF